MNALTTTGQHALRPQNFGELMEFAKMAARSSMVPRDYIGKPENILLAIQMGSEIGLAPMQSLQNISVINGRPSVWGDAMLGLCRQSPACKDVVERFEGDGKDLTAICIARRVGAEPIERRFSMDDAERAGLAGKPGTWQQYPKRMLQMRARGFALRDAFPDVLRGLISTEEAQDIPEDKFKGQTIEPDTRDALNDTVPLKAAAAATPRAPVKRAPVDAEDAYQAPPSQDAPRARTKRELIDGMVIALSDATTAEQVDKIICAEDIVTAKDTWPDGEAKSLLNKHINAALKKWWHEPPTAPAEEPDPDLEIVGEKYAAGD